MPEPATASAPITCRRCGEIYHHQGPNLLRACPHCGAAPVPLRHHLRHNGLAAVLAVLAAVVLVCGMVTPFISMTKLGISRIYSLVGGILELFHSGNTFIAVILLTFSVIFPFVKLAMLLAATSGIMPLSQDARRVLHRIALFTGKYSLLDLLVVAVMIVLVKFGPIADVEARSGTILFGVAVLLSMAAGFCVNVDQMSEDEAMEEVAPSATTTRRSRIYLKLLWLLLGLGILAPGLWYQYNVPPGGTVDAIKLSTKQGMVGQAAEAVANVDPTTPDLYLMIFTTAGETRLPTFKDTPVGNGLTWNLPKVLSILDMQRIEVWDHHSILSDKQLDRLTLDNWSVDGQRFHIDLLGHPNAPPKWALPVIAVGATLSILAFLKFVWDQVI